MKNKKPKKKKKITKQNVTNQISKAVLKDH